MLNPHTLIIAEVKDYSPIRGQLVDRCWDEQFEIVEPIGDEISVHDDWLWRGTYELIARARRMTKKPILAKGFHETDDDIKRALDNGADEVLVVGRVPAAEYIGRCLLEPWDIEQLKAFRAMKDAGDLPDDTKVVWNSRDISDLTVERNKSESYSDAIHVWDGWAAQASNIRTVADVHPQADAVLIGTHAEEFEASRRAISGTI